MSGIGSQALIASSAVIESFNMVQINGVAASVANGTADSGTQRVTIASNSTGQSKITDGTNTANVLAATSVSNSLSNQGAILTAPADMEVTFTTTTVQALPSIDVTNYRSVSVHITSQGTNSTITFQGSNDNANWVSVPLIQSNAVGITTPAVSATSAGLIYSGPINWRYFRLNVTGISAGTTAGIMEVSTLYSGFLAPGSGSYIADNVDGVTAVGSGVLKTLTRGYLLNGSGTYDRTYSVANGLNSAGTGIQANGIVGQFDDVSPGTITENQWGPIRMSVRREVYNQIRDAAGNERGANVNANNEITVIEQGLRPAGTALNTYSVRIASNTTTTPTSSTAYISSITVTVETAGTTSAVDIRDKSGTPIYIVRSLSTAAVFTNGIDTFNFQTPIKATSGIDIITTGAAAATISVFVNYYQ